MYIAGSYDDMQAGICYGGIAHAGGQSLQPAAWFSGDDTLLITNAATVTPDWSFLWQNYDHQSGLLSRFFQWGTPSIALTARFQTDNTLNILVGKASGGYIFNVTFGGLRSRAVSTFALTLGTAAGTCTLNLYKDGALVSGGTKTAAYTPLMYEGTLQQIRSIYSVGIMRDLGVYSRALSLAEIQAFEAGTPPASGLVLHIPGHGFAAADWTPGTLTGTPEVCYLTPNGKVIKGGIVQNP